MSPARLKRHRRQLLVLRDRFRGGVNGLIDAVPDTLNSTGNDTNLPTHPADRASEGLDAEMALLHAEEGLLGDVEAALRRIDSGAYGRCIHCRAVIDEARLNAIPYASQCIACARQPRPDFESPTG
jgi:DnaK suppressor protein